MRRITAVSVMLVLVWVMAVPATILAQPAGESFRTVGNNLQVVKLPVGLASEIVLAGNPHDDTNPTGKPDKPGKPDKQPAANKWAVVIGIADYAGSSNDLWHPDEDAKEMAKALEDNYGFSAGNIKLLLNRKATASAIGSAISWLVQNEDADSTVVFFYSGHGFNIADGEGWDSDSEADGMDEGIVSYDFYGITDGNLKQMLSSLESQKVFLGFGSCFSGGMFDDNDDLQEPNRVIASACQADEEGWDYLSLGNTLWGKYFVDEGLLQGLADTSGDGDVSIEEAHAYAYDMVTSVRDDSHPQLNNNYSGDMTL